MSLEPSTSSFVLEIDEITREGLRAVSDLRDELQEAFCTEKKENKLTQQRVASRLKVNRSVVNRQLTGRENLTVRKAAELAKAIGWKVRFSLVKEVDSPGQNESAPFEPVDVIPGSGTRGITVIGNESGKPVRPVEITSRSSLTTAE